MIIQGDCLKAMRDMQANSISCILTDPPYGLKFLGKEWDNGIPGKEYWAEALRVCKPGAMMLCFGGTRTYHRLAYAIEDAGWEIRDCLMWLYGSGFPKSLDISKAIDKSKGVKREIIGKKIVVRNSSSWDTSSGMLSAGDQVFEHSLPSSDLAKQFSGYGTTLKPAYEPILLCMKPLDGTFAQNAEKWGQAGINIDNCRIPTLTCQRLYDIISEKEVIWEQEKYLCNSCANLAENKTKRQILGIWESFAIKNVDQMQIESAKKFLTDLNIMDIGCSDILCQEEQREKVNENTSMNTLKSGKTSLELNLKDLLFIISTMIPSITESKTCSLCQEEIMQDIMSQNILALKKETLNMLKEHVKKEKGSRWPANLLFDEEAAMMLDEQRGMSRSPKGKCNAIKTNPLMKEVKGLHTPGREINWESYADSGGASRFFYCAKASSSEREGNSHPTIKPLKLLEYLITLIMPPKDGILLDPFAGSGSTCVAAKNIGVECIGIEINEEYCEIAKKREEAA